MTAPDEEEDIGEPQPPMFADVETWVEAVYSTTYIRAKAADIKWCSRWWSHPEAIVRLTALWQTWEVAQISQDPAAMADWIRTYLDWLNPPLLSAVGPFNECNWTRHNQPQPMPTEPVPAGWWGDPE
jgi:hypothetical protein